MRHVMAKCLVAALLALGCAAVALAQAPGGETPPAVQLASARVLDFGEFSSTVAQREHTPTVADGIKDRARDFTLLRRGAKLQARLGTGIGLRYQLEGTPKGATVLVDVVVRHPQIVNPDTGQTMTHSTAQYERTVGKVEHALWSFDTPADLVAGEYVIEISYHGRLLARQAFQVTLKK